MSEKVTEIAAHIEGKDLQFFFLPSNVNLATGLFHNYLLQKRTCRHVKPLIPQQVLSIYYYVT